MAMIHDVLARPSGYDIPTMASFDLSDGRAVDADIVIENDHITPYFFNHTQRELVFSDLPPEIDLRTFAFPFADQGQLARSLVTVPYEQLRGLAERVPPPRHLAFIYNPSRSGSTLLHRVFEQIEGVSSYGELTFFGDLIASANGREDRAPFARVLGDAVRLAVYPFAGDVVSFKHQSECTAVADLLYSAFPDATHIYLYRNALDWAASWQRMFVQWGSSSAAAADHYRLERSKRTGVAEVADAAAVDESLEQINAFLSLWLYSQDAFLEHHKAGVPFLTIRYEDLNAHSREILTAIVEQFGLPARAVEQGMRGFDGDSQIGTGLARHDGKPNQRPLREDETALVTRRLAEHDPPWTTDPLLPGTLLSNQRVG